VVPSKTQWEDLFNSLDTYYPEITGWPILGTKLREAGWDHWYDFYDEQSGIEGTDNYGFTLFGSGDRGYDDGLFLGLKQSLQMWSSTDLGDGLAYAIYTAFSINEITDSNGNYNSGYSIRICNPSTTLSDGEIGSYTGNDGKKYSSIVINGVEWLSLNLSETQFRDNSWINGYNDGVYTPILDEDWYGNVNSSMLCAYDNVILNSQPTSIIQILSDKMAVWRHNSGEYSDYHGVKYNSYITLLVAPEPDIDCVLNNVEFKSEVYNNGVDVPLVTMSKIRAWNNYQDSNTQTLTVGQNIKRKYRDWNLFVPRVYGKPLQRIRNPWNFLRLDFDNTNNYRLVLHDTLVSYDAIYKR